nr:hypothetical protein [Tanacetum cinerariifolium]
MRNLSGSPSFLGNLFRLTAKLVKITPSVLSKIIPSIEIVLIILNMRESGSGIVLVRMSTTASNTIRLNCFNRSRRMAEGAARIWLEKEPPRSILTWDDLVSKFINQFFHPLKTTNLRNEITRFQQRFDESFSEAWDRFNDLLRACPHHGFSELHQLDTFYNALNVNDQDSLNSAAGGNFLDKMPSDCLKIIESKSKVQKSRAKAVVSKVNSNSSTPAISSDVAELKDMMVANQIRPPRFPPLQNNQNNFNQGNNFTQNRGGNFNQSAFNPSQLYRPQVNQSPAYQAPIPQMQNVSQTNFERYVKANDAVLRNIQSQGSGTLPGNTVTNPKEDLKGITTRSGVAYKGPTIPTLSKVVKQGTEAKKDPVQTPNPQSTAHVQPPVTQSETSVSEPIAAPVSAPMPNQKPSIPYPSRRKNERRREQANEQIEKFYEI